MSFKILVVVLSATALCFARQEYQDQALYRHNYHRSSHEDYSVVVYDELLEEQSVICAGAYASGAMVPHECAIEGVGENAFLQIGGDDNEYALIDQAINLWYDEIKNYNFDDPASSTGEYNHFTQVVWKASVNIGCGVGISGANKSVVCSYSPQGNVHVSGGGDEFALYHENVGKLK